MRRDDGGGDERLRHVAAILRRAAEEDAPPEGIAARALFRGHTGVTTRHRGPGWALGAALAAAAVAVALGHGWFAAPPRDMPPEDDFIRAAPTLLADSSGRQIVAAVESRRREAAAIDTRLARPITIRVKATALGDLCAELREKSGVRFDAGASVADEKVTLLCAERPLREVMRALSRPFGYTWLRSGKTPEYRYELVQDLRSQLLEEELRNRDRHAALLALESEIERYGPYLALSPDEALARAEGAAPEEKRLLEKLAGYGWGPLQIYSRLTPRDMAALRSGQTLTFSAEPKPGEQPLPADLARGVLQSLRETRLIRRDDGLDLVPQEKAGALSPASVPEVRAVVNLRIDQSELGQFMLDGGSGITFTGNGDTTITTTDLATGISPRVREPENSEINARRARDQALRVRVTVRPESSCSTPDREAKKVTSADVLEALHHATGLPIVADYYTRLYPVTTVSVTMLPLFEALNRLADAMRLRWAKEPDSAWLQFRSASYYDDRLKEVPNRLLSRWVQSRREHGALTLDDLLQIVQLSDVQLDSRTMAEGAKRCFGLIEWDLVRHRGERSDLRFLAQLTPAQRRSTLSGAGLAFSQMSLAQQQQFIRLAFRQEADRLPPLEQLAEATLRVQYTQPGAFEWKIPDEDSRAPRRPSGRAIPREPIELSPIREETREAAIRAAHRIDSHVLPEEIVPTELAVSLLYTWGTRRTGFSAHAVRITPNYTSTRDETARPDNGAPSAR